MADHVAAGPLSIEETASIIRDVIEAVARIHACGLLERGLCPQRVIVFAARAFVTDDPAPRDRGAFDATLERFSFMAPEQVRGSVNVGDGADIYAIGALAFFALTGKHPFTGSNALTLIALKMDCDAPTLESAAGRAFPPLVESFVATALARDSAKRYPSIGVAREAWRLAVS